MNMKTTGKGTGCASASTEPKQTDFKSNGNGDVTTTRALPLFYNVRDFSGKPMNNTGSKRSPPKFFRTVHGTSLIICAL